jgi:hypothetical protein
MSTDIASLPTDPKILRPLLHRDIDRLSDADLQDAHKALLELEIKRTADELGLEMDEAWASGHLSKESIDAAVKEYRRTQPYRR